MPAGLVADEADGQDLAFEGFWQVAFRELSEDLLPARATFHESLVGDHDALGC